MRSTSRTSAASLGSEKGDVLGHHLPHTAGRQSGKHLDTVYSADPAASGDLGTSQAQNRV